MEDLTGVSLTTAEVREVTADIQEISKDIEGIMKSVDATMTTIVGSSEGGIIVKIDETFKQLFNAVEDLVSGIFLLGVSIGNFLKTLLTHDSDAADKIIESARSRIS